MAIQSTQHLPLGASAIPFSLPISNPWIDENPASRRSMEDYAGTPALVVVFTCNHCPYAIHVEDELVRIAITYAGKVPFIAINSNDPVKYPADSFEQMTERARNKQFPFPYLFDESQDIARSYEAACTPDIYVFDKDRSLVYRGRLDETRPGQGVPSHGGDLRAVLEALTQGQPVPQEQYPSIGCSIKWK